MVQIRAGAFTCLAITAPAAHNPGAKWSATEPRRPAARFDTLPCLCRIDLQFFPAC